MASGYSKRSLLGSAAFGLLAFATQPAFAQANSGPSDTSGASPGQEIVVTGHPFKENGIMKRSAIRPTLTPSSTASSTTPTD
jgi:phage tail tape-measure protein